MIGNLKNTLLKFNDFLDTRYTLMHDYWFWLSIGIIVCGLFMKLGYWSAAGLLLLAATLIAEYFHTMSQWREYLAPPYTNNNSIWITKDGYSTAAGLSVSKFENVHLYKLVRVAQSSYSKDLFRREFVRSVGKHYNIIGHVTTIAMILLSTAITLRT